MLATSSEIIYPDSDGLPMADNTKQFRLITTIHGNLDWLFRNEELVFVAGDLLWYPVEGNPKYRVAPDVMVAFGRPKGDRGSYKQWQEDNIAPQVVFEILSPGNTEGEMDRKLQIYARCGVEEYYIYDPDRYILKGYQRSEDLYLERIDEMTGWTSPRLGINFQLNGTELQLTHPDGRIFETFDNVATQRDSILADNQRLEIDNQRLEIEKQKRDNKLRELGIDPDTL
ncbi:Uma2 family endonuclease [Chamaesiphon sp. GL140_3_metabinner_50]|uniref:Uma2 family endonuclease n=1 Tax=Chamaesiphon sp. GL140_3_metabinner_50 TaxID=2970812 RepID=UPI0025E40376|nr:Uma2 family endonuclease [Chamaesiphon sp. GL140_3_metabinner_50]